MKATSSAALGYVMVLALLTAEASALQLVVDQQGETTTLSIDAEPPLYPAFHTTEATVSDEELIEIGGSTTLVVYWKETVGQVTMPYYTFSFDGQHFLAARRASYVLKLHYAEFDPLQGVPTVPASLAADPTDELYVVQFFSQPLPEFHQEIGTLGGELGPFLGAHANIVRMDVATKTQVSGLAYVRWVGEYHPAHRLGDFVRASLESPSPLYPDHRYNIVLFGSEPVAKGTLAGRIGALGGTVHGFAASSLLLPATLTPDQLLSVVHWDEVLFVGLWESATTFMDKVRVTSGGQYIHNARGYTGKGVTGQVMDNWLLTSHEGFNRCSGGDSDGMSCFRDDDCGEGTCAESPVLQGPQWVGANHGTHVYGTVFGDGTSKLAPK